MRWIVMMGLGLAACGGGEAKAPVAAAQPDVRTLRDFTSVTLDGPDRVDVRQGPAFAVRLEGDPAVLQQLVVRRDGETLRIGRRNSNGWFGGKRGVAQIHVTMPVLDSATLAGSGDIAIDRTGEAFAGTLSGSGDMTIGQLRGEHAALSVAGSGTLSAAGDVRRLTLSAVGSGRIDARQVRAGEAVVSITGSGDVDATVNGPAQVSLVGSGSATLGGGARCTVNRLGSGTANCG